MRDTSLNKITAKYCYIKLLLDFSSMKRSRSVANTLKKNAQKSTSPLVINNFGSDSSEGTAE